MLAGDVIVHEDGCIEGQTREARQLIRVLGLDDPAYNEFRGQWLCMIGLAKEHDPTLYRELMGYPNDLPDLTSLRPPQGNTRPEGVLRSCFARQQAGALPATY